MTEVQISFGGSGQLVSAPTQIAAAAIPAGTPLMATPTGYAPNDGAHTIVGFSPIAPVPAGASYIPQSPPFFSIPGQTFVEGSTYYLQPNKTLATTPVTNYVAGVAISDTVLQSTGATGAAAPPVTAPVSTVLTASGTYTAPANATYFMVELVGGGAAGAMAPAGVGTCKVGASGGAGGYVRALVPAALMGASKPVVIGAGAVASLTAAATVATATTLGGATFLAANPAPNATVNVASTPNAIERKIPGGVGGTFFIVAGLIDVGSCNGAAGELSAAQSDIPGTTYSWYLGRGGLSMMDAGVPNPAKTSVGAAAGAAAGVSGLANTGNGGSGSANPGLAATAIAGSGGSGKCRITAYFG